MGFVSEETLLLSSSTRSPAERALTRTLRKNWSVLRSKNRVKSEKEVHGWRVWSHKVKQRVTRFHLRWKDLSSRLEVWRMSLKKVEGTYGSGVVSYFRFLKWLFFLDVCLCVIWTGFVVLPEAVMSEDPEPLDNSTVSSFRQNLTEFCSERYIPMNSEQDPVQLIIDFLQGTGYMEQTALFYGRYSGRPLSVKSDNYESYYNLPMAYLAATLAFFILTLFLMARKISDSLRTSLVQSSRSRLYGYCNAVFGGWDFTLTDRSSALVRNSVIYTEIMASLDEDREALRRSRRHLLDTVILTIRRFAINVVVLGLLAFGGWLIYTAQTKTTELMEEAGRYPRLIGLFFEFIPSLTITGLNVIFPFIFDLLVKLEDYSPDFTIQITLSRTVFIRLASLAVLLATLYAQITCSTMNMCDVGVAPCPHIQCWETFVGQAIYKLIILNFVTVTIIIFLVEFPRRILVTYIPWKVFKIVGRQRFEIPKHVIDLVYAQTLCWLGTFFCPLIPLIYVFKLFLLFYMKKLTCLYNYVPTARPYGSSRSHVFFMLVLLAAFLLSCVPIGYVLWQLPPSKGCGPFRYYDDSFTVLLVAVQNWPPVLQGVGEFCLSAGFRVAMFTVLVLLAYFYYVAASGRREMVSLLREQVTLESRDKQFLLIRLSEATGGKVNVSQIREKGDTSKTAPGDYHTMETAT